MISFLVFGLMMAVMLNATAFAANAGILWVVLRNKNLKRAPTSVFLVNLCAADLAIALIVIPMATAVFILASSEDEVTMLPTGLCGSLSFFHSLLVYAGAWAAAAISVDRRFSIVAPMAHAAFMTSRRALVGVAMVWIMAIVFAVLPHLLPSHGSSPLFSYSTTTSSVETKMMISIVSSSSKASTATNDTSRAVGLLSNSTAANSNSSASTFYMMSVSTSTSTSSVKVNELECHLWKTCALMFAMDWSDTSHVFSVMIGCYLIPTCIMVSMYLSIFKVARKAGLQVRTSNHSTITTVCEEVEAKEESVNMTSNAGDDPSVDIMMEGVTEVCEPRDELIIQTALRDKTLNSTGIQIGPVKSSESKLSSTPDISMETENTRHCIFRHLFESQMDAPALSVDRFGDDIEETSRSSRSCSGDLAQTERVRRCSENKRCSDCGTRNSSSKISAATAGCKARRTLLLILGLSLLSWTPYYLVHTYCACTNDCWIPISICPNMSAKPDEGRPRTGGLEENAQICNITCDSDAFPITFLVYQRSIATLVVAWLLFLSSAFNPILYGLLNRPVREQIVLRASALSTFCNHTFRRFVGCMCATRGKSEDKQPSNEDEEADGGMEDFLQFLERTSSLSDAGRSSSVPNDRN